MTVTFKTKKFEKSITTSNGLQRAYGQYGKRVNQRYGQLRSSATLADFQKIQSARLHPLTGDREGQWAVNITGNRRLCFILTQNPVPRLPDGGVDLTKVTEIELIEITDYH